MGQHFVFWGGTAKLESVSQFCWQQYEPVKCWILENLLAWHSTLTGNETRVSSLHSKPNFFSIYWNNTDFKGKWQNTALLRNLYKSWKTANRTLKANLLTMPRGIIFRFLYSVTFSIFWFLIWSIDFYFFVQGVCIWILQAFILIVYIESGLKSCDTLRHKIPNF